MPRFITDTVDEQLAILVIADPSNLASALTASLQERGFALTEVSISNAQNALEVLRTQEWYKVVVVVESPRVITGLEVLHNSLQQLPVPPLVLFKLSASVSDQTERTNEWFARVNDEVAAGRRTIAWFGEKNFIFYRNILEVDNQIFSYITQNITQGVVFDPLLNLGFLAVDDLVIGIMKTLLLPKRTTRLLTAVPKKTSLFVQQLVEMYGRFFQQKVTIVPTPLSPVTHPLLATLTHEPEELMLSADPKQALTTLVKNLPLVKQNIEHRSMMNEVLSPPQKNSERFVEDEENEFLAQPEVKTPSVPETKNNDNKENKEINIDESINSVFSNYREEQKQTHIKRLVGETKKGQRKVRSRRLLFKLGIGVAGLALSLLVLCGVIVISGNQLRSQLMALMNAQAEPVTAQQKKLISLKRTSHLLSQEVGFFTKTLSLPLFPKTTELLAMTEQMGMIADQEAQLQTQTITFYQQLVGKEQGDSLESLQKLHTSAATLNQDLSLLIGQVKAYSELPLNPEQKEQFFTYEKELQEKQQSLTRFQQLYPLLPALLGEDSERTYAVILQNEQELRPTGGFIQAVALLRFSQGKLTEVTVKDVYTLDQQLTAFVDSPNEIKQFLGEVRWYTRDANWNPDYPQSAKQVAWFIENGLGIKVDGVIALDGESLGNIISALEQVSLPEYNEIITQNNLAERLEFNSEIQLVQKEGKPDYSQLLLTKVFEAFQQLETDKVLPLLSSLEQSAQEKELLVYFSRSAEQATSGTLGWSGAMAQPNCPPLFTTKNCVVDSVYQVEANIGVNKANYYLQRQVDHSIQVTPTVIAHKRRITLKNTAQSNAWPKGPYRAFTRLYVDQTASLTDLTVNGASIKNAVSVYQENNRQVWAFVTETPVQSESDIEVTYTLPHTSSSPFTYVFFDQKQPGARDVSPRVFLSFDQSLTPTLIAPQADVNENLIIFNPSKDTGHMFVGASFQ